MKTAQLTDIRTIEINDVPPPTLQHDSDVLLRIKRVGVCGSDIHYFSTGRIGEQIVDFPFTMGHECAAVVEEVGSEVFSVKPGDRVAVEPAVYCHHCDQCRSGRKNTCRNLNFLGCPGQLPGALSEYLVMPEESCLRIPDEMSFDAAVVCEPLAIGLYSAYQAPVVTDAKIGILGAGPVGLSIMLAAQRQGADKIYVTDKLDYRVTAAAEHGADAAWNVNETDVLTTVPDREPLLLDTVFECCGQQEAFDQAVSLLKPGGTLVLVGIPEFDRYSFQADSARRKELRFRNIRRQNDCAEDAIRGTADGSLDTKFMVTHHFKLEETQQAFELVENYKDGVIKAMVEI
ncbi:MAG: zinc-dependent alcohol dehydrogenase [Lentisphaeria bacterium]